MKKAEALAAWKGLDPDLPMLRHMESIPYKAKGSTYGACGVRIDGNPAFVDAVLSHLQELIDGENCSTRLGLSRNVVDGSGLDKAFFNTADQAECCYVRLHERGSQGQMASAVFDKHLHGATERFLTSQGR